MKMQSMLLLAAFVFTVAAVPAPAMAADKACVKREMAKGRSECIAKAKCDGVTSRKDQARLCGG